MTTLPLLPLTPEELAQERLRRKQMMLNEEFNTFLAEWKILESIFENGWVPIRLLPITGMTAWALLDAEMIEVFSGHARPL